MHGTASLPVIHADILFEAATGALLDQAMQDATKFQFELSIKDN